MAALLEAETAAYPELRRGEIIEGVVVGTDRDGILVDIGAKSEGVVPPQEMHCLQPEGPSRLSNGDKVLVFIVQPESQEGQIILSLDRARGERGWRVLQDYLEKNEAFEAYITGSNKGGLLVNVEGVNAFVPLSQLVSGPDRGIPGEHAERASPSGSARRSRLKVIELNRRRNRAILSERAAVQEKRAAEKERLLARTSEGDVRKARVTSIRDFGIFVDIGGADGLVHLSELSWERTPKSPHELFKVGDEVPVFVLKIDNESKKIALSVRRAQPERWEEIVANYREGQVVPGQVTKLAPFGAFVRLEGPIEGLIHISELVDRRINHPTRSRRRKRRRAGQDRPHRVRPSPPRSQPAPGPRQVRRGRLVVQRSRRTSLKAPQERARSPRCRRWPCLVTRAAGARRGRRRSRGCRTAVARTRPSPTPNRRQSSPPNPPQSNKRWPRRKPTKTPLRSQKPPPRKPLLNQKLRLNQKPLSNQKPPQSRRPPLSRKLLLSRKLTVEPRSAVEPEAAS